MARKHKADAVLCGAQKKGGGRCILEAGFGTDHVGFGTCKYHGGTTPSHKANAQRLEVRAEMEVMKSKFLAQELVEDPHRVLLKMVYLSNAMVAWLGEQIQRLEEDNDFLERDRQSGMSQLNVYLRAHAEERDRAARTSKMAIDAGVAERLVQVEEAKAMMLARIIQSVLDDLHLSPEQQKDAPRIVRTHLLELDSSPPTVDLGRTGVDKSHRKGVINPRTKNITAAEAADAGLNVELRDE